MSYAITHVICYLILLGFPCFRGLPCFHHVLELRGNLTYFASLSVDFLCSDKSLFFLLRGNLVNVLLMRFWWCQLFLISNLMSVQLLFSVVVLLQFYANLNFDTPSFPCSLVRPWHKSNNARVAVVLQNTKEILNEVVSTLHPCAAINLYSFAEQQSCYALCNAEH